MLEQLANFHFIRPLWLFAIIPLVFVAWVYAHRSLKAGNWSRVCDDRLLPFILIGQQQTSSPWRLVAMVLCGLLLILALAGPAWNKLPQPVFRSQAALVIALDLSRSMDVTDIKPSRLARARHKILDILDRRQEGQTALIVYAAEPFVVTPLTEDIKTVATLVKDLTTDLIPYQGSYPEKAVQKAIELFKQASIVNGHVLMVTDGMNSSSMDSAVSELTGSGYSLSVLGIGTEQGAPIADRGGGFVKDRDGSIVLARLDEQQLREVARYGNGLYRQISANDSDINSLLQVISPSRISDEFSANDDTLKLESDQWHEEGPWLLLLLLPFVALIFRRGYLAVMLMIVLVPFPQESYAFEWSSLWKNNNQQAAKTLQQGNSQAAAELFTDPEWKGAANYRAGEYQKAIESLDGIQKPDALYNRGNALAKAGDLQQAISAYDEALKMNPDHEDAKYNRDLLQQYLEQQQQQQDGDQSQNDADNQQNNEQQNQQNKQSQKDNQSAEDQQSQASENQQADGSDSENQQQNQQQSSTQDDQQNEQQQQADSEQSQQDAEQQQAQAEQQQQGEEQQDNNDAKPEDSDARMAQKNNELDEDPETMQRTEQWLRRIPDDPGGLLRRKFRYQSQIDPRQAQGETQPW